MLIHFLLEDVQLTPALLFKGIKIPNGENYSKYGVMDGKRESGETAIKADGNCGANKPTVFLPPLCLRSEQTAFNSNYDPSVP